MIRASRENPSKMSRYGNPRSYKAQRQAAAQASYMPKKPPRSSSGDRFYKSSPQEILQYIQYRKEARDPRNGEKVTVEPHYKATFIPGKDLQGPLPVKDNNE